MSCNFKIPILFDMKSQCCGCAACATVCKRNAIDMENDLSILKLMLIVV